MHSGWVKRRQALVPTTKGSQTGPASSAAIEYTKEGPP